MIGANDFMRAWRDVCESEYVKSGDSDCPLREICFFECRDSFVAVRDYSDKGINDLITAVMAEKARREHGDKA